MEVIFWGLALEHIILIGLSLGLNLILLLTCIYLCCRIRRREGNTKDTDMTNMNDNELGHDYERTVIPSRATSMVSVTGDYAVPMETVDGMVNAAPSKPPRGDDLNNDSESDVEYVYAEPRVYPAAPSKDKPWLQNQRSFPFRQKRNGFQSGTPKPVYANTLDNRA
ncbi:uncharacterized protein LOC105443149 [Strongylocentrotus purpuratus]|uniref:Uncharacterized protein n=1 Tax=Strongylocentrotus purpuratus TaxID=7668 RepID=A0A7M7HGH4_STRPU|nr:uncharacterized protein LOC105443149 [Strongylocentrotus purpuratus]|eukprot:XP_011674301.1 PREDICTED: uncharacterized protein LOC105443149 [Strongylocentrotus purpuratus]